MYLTEENINKNPFKQFEIWFEEAKKIGLKDPNAMNVASATKNGVPSSRMVLLKAYVRKDLFFIQITQVVKAAKYLITQ